MVHVSNIESRDHRLSFKASTDSIDALTVLADGRLASTDIYARVVRIWDPSVGASAVPNGHAGPVMALVALADGRVVSGGTDALRVWDGQTSSEITRFDKESDGAIHLLEALPNGGVAYNTVYDRSLQLWGSEGEFAGLARAHPFGRIGLLTALDTGEVAAFGGARDIQVFGPATGEPRREVSCHRPVSAFSAVALPNGRLATGTAKSVQIWDLTGTINRYETWHGSDHPKIGAFITGTNGAMVGLPDGRIAAVGVLSSPYANSSEIWIYEAQLWCDRWDESDLHDESDKDSWRAYWSSECGAPWDEVFLFGKTRSQVQALAALEDGRLISGAKDGAVRLWDPKARTELASLELDAAITCLVSLGRNSVVAGDQDGNLHWLRIVG